MDTTPTLSLADRWATDDMSKNLLHFRGGKLAMFIVSHIRGGEQDLERVPELKDAWREFDQTMAKQGSIEKWEDMPEALRP